MFDWIRSIQPSTLLHEENKIIIESEKSIREATRKESLKYEEQYLKDYYEQIK